MYSIRNSRLHRCAGPMAQWIRRRSTEPKIPGSIPGRVTLLHFAQQPTQAHYFDTILHIRTHSLFFFFEIKNLLSRQQPRLFLNFFFNNHGGREIPYPSPPLPLSIKAAADSTIAPDGRTDGRTMWMDLGAPQCFGMCGHTHLSPSNVCLCACLYAVFICSVFQIQQTILYR